MAIEEIHGSTFKESYRNTSKRLNYLSFVFFTPVYTAHCVVPTAEPANDMQRG